MTPLDRLFKKKNSEKRVLNNEKSANHLKDLGQWEMKQRQQPNKKQCKKVELLLRLKEQIFERLFELSFI